ncbi:DNA repair helicase (Rad3) (macronuclear) [Tetrahymena thermophila SB210]|uniref:DNA repair helicase (Rad3) n=1 Tax=Tetrahymena thermophila (strain SB210) TaxID=312017 RepID=I7MAY7_TETTS|nr:DNA repair helicase (Rad3) [Tetrahymena thermophila SB210]EAS06738.2 DNA repair helicase (Rad3) [Tetrahymena thermophila SB210]|eukprot:XP_001026980.2 DNA repair helicase (Rad3) [Tetrahymena thermophila SB210]
MSSSDILDVEQRQKAKLEPIIKVEKHHISKREIELDQAKMLIHHQLNFHGVDILFPFKPYQIQEDYMRSIVEALNSKSNALLQSPTGTGKTLSLLCACLGWLRQKRASQQIQSDGIVNRIYFCSRTHSQLKQVMKELKATAYKPKVCIMGSREQYCLKKEYSNLKDLELNGSCKDAIKKKTCQFYNYSGDGGKQQPKILDEVLDIEELQERGRCKKFCPYYYSREIKDDADLIILPYSFLLKQSRFQEFQVILKDSIIIFDEAHNVPSAAEEGTSYKVDQNLIEESNKELDYLEKNLTPNMRTDTYHIKEARQLINAIGNLIKYFEKEGKIEKFRDGTNGFVCSVSTLFEKIEQIGGQLLNYSNNKKKISYEKYKKTSLSGTQFFDYKDMLTNIKKQRDDRSKPQSSQQQPTLFNFNFKKNAMQSNELVCDKTTSDDLKDTDQEDNQVNDNQFLSSFGYKSNKQSAELSMKRIVQISKKLSMIIQDMQTMKCQNIDFFAGFIVGICDMYEQEQLFLKGKTIKKLSDYYKFYFHKSSTKYEQSSINLWCLDPSVAFQNILNEGPYSIMLTSGTLHPMNSWESELNIKFDVKLATSHIINIQKSVVGGVVKNGPNKMEMNFSFNNRQNGIKIYEELGQFLIQLCNIVPNGILVCFSSGSLMQLARDSWLESQLNIIQRLNAIKDVFFEPRSNVELSSTMKSYCNAAERDDRGAIMFCVCRGKISEGIDFTDKLARSVVVVGVPFPPAADTWVVTKMDYLDKKQSKENTDIELKTLNGKEWYFLCTVRALNQAIGRVIRHKDDYGSVYLCDNRFTQNQFQDQISGWVRPALKNYSTFEYLLNDCQNFFNSKNQSVTTFDEILKLGNNKKSNVQSVREIAQKELAEGKLSCLTQEKSITQNADSKRKVYGSFKQILMEKEKKNQQSPLNNVASPNNFNNFSISPNKFQQQQQQSGDNQFTNIFLENQKKLMSQSNSSNQGKIQQSIPQNISTKNIFQLIQECESSNSNPFLYEQPSKNDSFYKTTQDHEKMRSDLQTFQQAFSNNQQKNSTLKDIETSQMEIENQPIKPNDARINIKFEDSMTNQSQYQDQDTSFSINSKKGGMFEQIRQKRRIIINESQEPVVFQKSPMSVEKNIVCNSQSQQDLQQPRILRLKSSSIPKEPSFIMNQKDRALSQQSLITLNKPLIMKGDRDEMINLFRNGSDDESSNSFEIMRPQNDRGSLNIKSVESKESSLNFLNDIFKKHQALLINENQNIRESSLDQKVTLSLQKSKESSSPQSENLIESSLRKRKKSLKLTPSTKEEGMSQQKSFIEIINSRNSTGSIKSISPISKLQQYNQNDNQQDDKVTTNQIVISPSEQKLNVKPNQKIMLQNSARGLASFDGDVIKYQRKQNKDEETPIKSASKEQDNLCPICYEVPKNNHKSTACQHYACYSCWQTWLAEQLTCPMCRVRCRVAYLEPFSLN